MPFSWYQRQKVLKGLAGKQAQVRPSTLPQRNFYLYTLALTQASPFPNEDINRLSFKESKNGSPVILKTGWNPTPSHYMNC